MPGFLDYDGDLVTFWKSKNSITQYVGTGQNAKILPDSAKQGWTGAYIVYTAAGGSDFRHHGGITGFRETVLHVYCFADSAAVADRLAERVKIETESVEKANMGSTRIEFILATTPDAGYDQQFSGTDQPKYWRRIVFNIVHSQAFEP